MNDRKYRLQTINAYKALNNIALLTNSVYLTDATLSGVRQWVEHIWNNNNNRHRL